MNEKTLALIKKYPKMFPENKKGQLTELMMFGFEDCWTDYVDKLMVCIQSYIDQNEHLKIPQVHINQIKEKFGMLRFYYSGGDETIHGMVWFAENYSQYLCEKCSKPGYLKDNGHNWYFTLCDKHWKEEEKRINKIFGKKIGKV